jgi:hypothetical protein
MYCFLCTRLPAPLGYPGALTEYPEPLPKHAFDWYPG